MFEEGKSLLRQMEAIHVRWLYCCVVVKLIYVVPLFSHFTVVMLVFYYCSLKG